MINTNNMKPGLKFIMRDYGLFCMEDITILGRTYPEQYEARICDKFELDKVIFLEGDVIVNLLFSKGRLLQFPLDIFSNIPRLKHEFLRLGLIAPKDNHMEFFMTYIFMIAENSYENIKDISTVERPDILSTLKTRLDQA